MISKRFFALLLLAALLHPAVGRGVSAGAEVDLHRVKAGFAGAVPADIESWAAARGATVALLEPRLSLVVLEAAKTHDASATLEALQARADVRWASYDAVVRAAFVPDDPAWPEQYGPRMIGAPTAWDARAGSWLTIAILDTGVDATHPDLADACQPGCASGAYDVFGHGTHVAGIAGAAMNNGHGIAGVAPVELVSVKALSDAGASWWSVLAVAILDASERADIISMSLAGDCDLQGRSLCPEVQEAVDLAWSRGRVLVAASGNDGRTWDVSEPASLRHVVAVGAVDAAKARADFSNGGPTLDLVAPGMDVLSTVPVTSILCGTQTSGLCFVSGTSMAAPHVAGAAALVWARCPHATNEDVVARLVATAEDLGPAGRDDLHGAGLVRADLASATC